jgi:parallel beta-helix repeat protein
MVKRLMFLGSAMAVVLALAASPAAATHVGCGDVITQDTTLDSDLVDCAGDGVVIGAAGITLDLAGHTIDGTGPGAGAHGVRNAGADNVTVTNGRIQQFQRAVWVLGADANLLTGLILTDSGSGAFVEQSSLTRILDSEMRSSGTGVTLWQSGSFNVIRGNSISGATNGVLLVGSFVAPFIERTEVSDNDVFSNSYGIHVLDANNTQVRGNRVVDNSGNGILDAFGGFSIIEGNFVSRNDANGIVLPDSTGAVVAGNRTWDNGGDGVLIGNSGSLIRPPAVTDNFSKGNGDDGIDVRAPRTTIARNKANVNADLGIEAVPGVVDGGGNKAAGNGNPAQCVNVSCK